MIAGFWGSRGLAPEQRDLKSPKRKVGDRKGRGYRQRKLLGETTCSDQGGFLSLDATLALPLHNALQSLQFIANKNIGS